MRRLVLSISLVFAMAGMCAGGGGEDKKEDKNDDPVVVPVADDRDDDGEDDGDWCCEYKDAEGSKQYALTDGPAECNTKYADQDGRWVSGNQCIPCCCKAPNDPDDAEKGYSYELTTPKSCVAGQGECLKADAEECGDDPKAKKPRRDLPKKPRPSNYKPKPRVVTP